MRRTGPERFFRQNQLHTMGNRAGRLFEKRIGELGRLNEGLIVARPLKDFFDKKDLIDTQAQVWHIQFLKNKYISFSYSETSCRI